MFYGVAIILIGLGWIAVAFQFGGWWFGLLWPAAVALIIGFAYLTKSVWVIGKRADGTLSPWALVPLFPYYAVTSTFFHLKCLLRGEDASNEVAPGLWVGRRPWLFELPPDTALVVDLTAEFPVHAEIRESVPWVCIPTLDGTAPDPKKLAPLVERILAEQGPVYVHCAAGHGRSGCTAAAVVIKRGLASSPQEAQTFMRKARPGVRLNADHRAAVRAVCGV